MIAFRSVTGMNETTFLLRPSTHAVSGEFANTRPEGRKKTLSSANLRCLIRVYDKSVGQPCLKFSFSCSEIHCEAFTPNLVPKFLSKGVGAPPCNTNTHTECYTQMKYCCSCFGNCTCCRCPNTLTLQSKTPFPSSE